MVVIALGVHVSCVRICYSLSIYSSKIHVESFLRYMCSPVIAHACVGVCTCVYRPRDDVGYFPQSLSILYIETGSLKPTVSVGLASHLALGSPCLQLPSAEITSGTYYLALDGCWGSKLPSPHIHGKHFIL